MADAPWNISDDRAFAGYRDLRSRDSGSDGALESDVRRPPFLLLMAVRPA